MISGFIMISSYKVVGNKIEVGTPYSEHVVSVMRKWAATYDKARGVWVTSVARLKDVQAQLGADQEDWVEVEVGENTSEDVDANGWHPSGAQIRIGWYILASRRERDRGAEVYAELVAGEIPSSGGSIKYPSVNASKDTRFRLWVPRDFAVARGLSVKNDPSTVNRKIPKRIANPLAKFTDEQIHAEFVRRRLSSPC